MPAPEHAFEAITDNYKNADAGASDLPVHKAERPVSPDGHTYSLVTIITSKERFLPLKIALEAIGITGMTVTEVHGYGLQKGHSEMYRGASVASRLLPKIRLDIVVSAIPPRTLIEIAKKVLYTGKYGDGKIFVSTIDNVVKIRTGEEGFDALQDYPI
jgi:Amt family ammonium transporter